MDGNDGPLVINKINQECFDIFKKKMKHQDISNIRQIINGGVFKPPLSSSSNEYQRVWDKYWSSLSRDFQNADFSGQVFFYGPTSMFDFFNKKFVSCNFSNTLWINFNSYQTTFSNCNFSNSFLMLSGGLKNKFYSCDFSKSAFAKFYLYGETVYQDCNFSDTTIHNDDIRLDISKTPNVSFTGSSMKGCTLIFSSSFNELGVKKLPKSKLKEYVNHLFTSGQIAQMKIDYNRLW